MRTYRGTKRWVLDRGRLCRASRVSLADPCSVLREALTSLCTRSTSRVSPLKFKFRSWVQITHMCLGFTEVMIAGIKLRLRREVCAARRVTSRAIAVGHGRAAARGAGFERPPVDYISPGSSPQHDLIPVTIPACSHPHGSSFNPPERARNIFLPTVATGHCGRYVRGESMHMDRPQSRQLIYCEVTVAC